MILMVDMGLEKTAERVRVTIQMIPMGGKDQEMEVSMTPTTHTLGEEVESTVIHMDDYAPDRGPGFGWPAHLPWVNPSPNLATVNAVRCYSGTVLLEGTTLSEGRGTTRPMELVGADLHTGAAFADVLVKGRLEIARAEFASAQPLRHRSSRLRAPGLQPV